ncbi:GNAT family N-acetyltransferase [Streptomyces sp. NPDC051976]|uniref:GNAT family N-acetyltransferase n=1 Tax=Streptomyces sp. NPDC051976 TaxID=3154947 RepID=UPI00342BE06A
MSALSLSPLRLTADDIADVVGIYASNPEYGRVSGEYDSAHIDARQVEAEVRDDMTGGSVYLLAKDGDGTVVGLVSVLGQHPKDGYPWIGLLMVHGDRHRTGQGRRLALAVEERLRTEDREGVRLAVLENNPTALAFWASLGWQEIDRRKDVQHGRPCVVMHKRLA